MLGGEADRAFSALSAERSAWALRGPERVARQSELDDPDLLQKTVSGHAALKA